MPPPGAEKTRFEELNERNDPLSLPSRPLNLKDLKEPSLPRRSDPADLKESAPSRRKFVEERMEASLLPRERESRNSRRSLENLRSGVTLSLRPVPLKDLGKSRFPALRKVKALLPLLSRERDSNLPLPIPPLLNLDRPPLPNLSARSGLLGRTISGCPNCRFQW